MPDPLDDRSVAQGRRPDIGDPPSSPLASHRRVGVGSDWIGVGGPRRWRTILFRDVVAVAVVPASGFKQWFFSRMLYAPGPDLVVRDRDDTVIDVDVRRVSAEIRQALALGLAGSAAVSPTARTFLESGELPGRWGRSMGYGGSRFGPKLG